MALITIERKRDLNLNNAGLRIWYYPLSKSAVLT